MEQQETILNKEFEVAIQKEKSWAEIQIAHSAADQTGNSTRPKIAMLMAYLVFFVGFVTVVVVFYSVIKAQNETLESLSDCWGIITAALATPTLLLRSYFGMRTKEKQSRYAASIGKPMPKGFMESLVESFQGRKP